jgi:hypothetical protein
MGIQTIGARLRPTGGSKTVSATGTAEPLVATSTPAYMLYVRAKADNTGNVYFGDSAVDKTTSKQVVLDAGDAITITPPHGNRLNLLDFYIDVDVNAEGVDLFYMS